MDWENKLQGLKYILHASKICINSYGMVYSGGDTGNKPVR